MKRALTSLPLATLIGCALGALFALVVAALSLGPLEESRHPLALFALAPLPGLLGAWLDWARLWRPSGRTRFWSLTLLLLTMAAALEAWLLSGDPLWAAALPLGALTAVCIGVVLLTRAPALFGLRLIQGRVRRDEEDQVILESEGGVITLDRRDPELGATQTVDVSIGAPLATLGRVKPVAPDGCPFRSERRAHASALVAVAPDLPSLRGVLRRRARAWATFLCALAVGATALVAAARYSPPAETPERAALQASSQGARQPNARV